MTITYHSSEILGRFVSILISFLLTYIVLFFYLDLYTPTFTFTLQLLHQSYTSNYLYPTIWAFSLTLPLVIYHLFSFLGPALYKHEYVNFQFSSVIYIGYLTIMTYTHIYLLQPDLFIDVLWEEMEGSWILPQFEDFVTFTFGIQLYLILMSVIPVIILNIKMAHWIMIKPWIYLGIGIIVTGFPFYTLEPEWWITMMIVLMIEIPSVIKIKRL